MRATSLARAIVPVVDEQWPPPTDDGLHLARILIVDDKEANVRLLECILKRAQFENFVSTTDSREVAAIFEDFQPDLVLTDWRMPNLDGLAVINRLGDLIASDDYLPIVVLTADVTEETKQRALAAGAADFLTNPFDQQEVLLRIENLLHSRLSHLKIQEQKAALEDSVRTQTMKLERALEELKGTQKQVIRQERLAALGTMASGIAHDFNNSLCVILGFTEVLLRDAEHGLTRGKAMAPLTTILTAAEDASEIVHRLRQFYRPPENDERRSPVKLTKIVEQAISLTTPRWKTQSIAAGKEITIATELGEIPALIGNAAELREALTNLIFNAVDAMPKGGTITFRTATEEEDVLLQISDNGTGMSEEVRQRCFEPFFAAKAEGGTGLGLAMVFGIVQRHSGSIELESSPGKGTTFTLRFPGSRAQSEDTVIDSVGFDERSLHVLVVDDQPNLCQLLRDYLENDLHTAETASSAQEALEKFRAGYFDLVITDQVMTGMNGYQLATALKQLKPHVPIILLTGFADDNTPDDNNREAVDLVIGKPLSRMALRSALAQVISP